MNAQARYALRQLTIIFAFVLIFGGVSGVVNVIIATALIGIMVIIISLTFYKIRMFSFFLGF